MTEKSSAESLCHLSTEQLLDLKEELEVYSKTLLDIYPNQHGMLQAIFPEFQMASPSMLSMRINCELLDRCKQFTLHPRLTFSF